MIAADQPLRLGRVQVLRFIAATAVVLYHAVAAAKARGLSQDFAPWAVYGAQGVDLFFVVSGFIIYYTVEVGRAKSFLRRRVERLVPLYWSFTLLVFAVGVALPGAFAGGGAGQWMTLPNLAASLLFASVPTESQTIVFVGWTLEFEMLFYLSAALLLAFSRWRWVILSTIFSLAVVAGRASGEAGAAFGFLTNPLLLEFVMGIVVAEWLLKGRVRPAIIFPLVAGLVACIPSFSGSWRIFAGGLPAAALLLFVAKADLAAPIGKSAAGRFLMLLGDASYSVYLVQVLSIAATYKLLLALLPGFPLLLLILVSTISTIAAGLVMYLILERPLINHFRAVRRRKRQAKPAEEGLRNSAHTS